MKRKFKIGDRVRTVLYPLDAVFIVIPNDRRTGHAIPLADNAYALAGENAQNTYRGWAYEHELIFAENGLQKLRKINNEI